MKGISIGICIICICIALSQAQYDETKNSNSNFNEDQKSSDASDYKNSSNMEDLSCSTRQVIMLLYKTCTEPLSMCFSGNKANTYELMKNRSNFKIVENCCNDFECRIP